jgi:hypothetical protein
VVHAFIFLQADDTARKAQRAFVAIRGIYVTPNGEVTTGEDSRSDISYRMDAIWENSGSTETRDLAISTSIALGELTRAFVPPFSRATSVLKSALSSQGKESWDYGPALTT